MQATSTSDPFNNKLIAQNIIDSRPDDEEVKAICSSDDFIKCPTECIIKKMIARGVGFEKSQDKAVAYIIGKIPDFTNFFSIDNLIEFATSHFRHTKNNEKILAVFKKSMRITDFDIHLKIATEFYDLSQSGDYSIAERIMRNILTVFKQAEDLKEFEFPAHEALV
ncbi:hypothetical protein BN1013_01982 [Candidatus Rubidus massiliensis]|nr:MAG: hypothetical protein BGO10_06705 [Chlamydia sp. 32-24]CDZ81446.1 hypothetical protein BN1013_01982 [Candidatus Rubidus massiliensis]